MFVEVASVKLLTDLIDIHFFVIMTKGYGVTSQVICDGSTGSKS